MKAERKGSQGEGNARAIKRTSSNLQDLVEIESTARPPMSTAKTSSSEKLRSQGGQSAVEPFPVVTEEDMQAHPPREKGSSHDISLAPSYDTAKEDLKDGSKIRGKGKSSSEDRHKEGPQQVCES